MPAVLFRCDGNPRIGMGHVVRCRALATAFSNLGWRCWFAISQESVSAFTGSDAIIVSDGNDGASEVSAAAVARNIDCLVVDHYAIDAQFEHAAAKAVSVIVVVDDLANRAHHCNLVVDANPERQVFEYSRLTAPGTRFLLGTRYALLRPEFHDHRRAHGQMPRRKTERLVIALGGADPDNASACVLEALPHLRGTAMKAVLVIGRANLNRGDLTARAASLGVEIAINPPNLVALMADADIAITGSGITCLEFACLGIPALAIILAENQRAIAHAIGNTGAARILDGSDRFDPQYLAATIMLIAEDWNLRRHMSTAGRKLVDGKGATRVAKEAAKLLIARKLETCP